MSITLAPGATPAGARGRTLRALAGMGFTENLAYGAAYWASIAQRALLIVIAAAFWRAVYLGQSVLAGMSAREALNYVLLARLLQPMSESQMLRTIGSFNMRGELAVELLRPVDFQASQTARALGQLAARLIAQLPLLIPVALLLGLRPTHSVAAWLGAAGVIVLGIANVMLFDWIVGCLAFFTTYIWGVSMFYGGLIWFFSGALLPLAFMPGWLQWVCSAFPPSQVVAVPAGLLAGQLDPARVPMILGLQIVGIGVLLPVSRWLFAHSVRHATVLGG